MSLTRLDENARAILVRVRDEMKTAGIDGANLSDAVRELNTHEKRSN